MYAPGIMVVAVYLVFCLLFGLYKNLNIQNIKEYTLGTRYFSTLAITATIIATDIGGSYALGAMENVYESGLLYGIPMLATVFAWIILVKVMAPNIDQFKGCLSISDVLASLYGEGARWITSIASILVSIGAVSIQVMVMGFLFEYFFHISYEIGALIGFSIVVLYSAIGGIKAVVITDIMQFLLFFIAFPLACALIIYKAGGASGIIKALPASHFNIITDHKSFWAFVVLVFYFLIPDINAPFIQRLLLAKDVKQLTRSLKIVALLSLLFNIIVVISALAVCSLHLGINPTHTLFNLIDMLPGEIVAFLIVAVLAVTMSTADSWLNSASSICAHDIFKKIFPNLSAKQEVFVARLSVFLISGMAVVTAFGSRSAFELNISLCNFWLVFLVPLFAGFMNFRTKPLSFYVSATIGILFAFLEVWFSEEMAGLCIMIGLILSAVGFFGTHYWQHYGELRNQVTYNSR